MASPAVFANRMRLIAKSIPVKAVRGQRRTAKAMLGTAGMVSRVDTSRFVSNWQIGLGDPKTLEINPYFPGDRGSTRSESTQAMLAVGNAAIGSSVVDTPIFISQNADYWPKLQAADGFIEQITMVGGITANRIRLLQ